MFFDDRVRQSPISSFHYSTLPPTTPPSSFPRLLLILPSLSFFSSTRQTGQATAEDIRSRDLRRELEEKERDARERKDREKTRSFTGEVGGQRRREG